MIVWFQAAVVPADWLPLGPITARVGLRRRTCVPQSQRRLHTGVSKRPKEPVYYPSGELNCVKQISFAKYSPPEEGDTGAPKRVGHKSSVDCCMYIASFQQLLVYMLFLWAYFLMGPGHRVTTQEHKLETGQSVVTQVTGSA
ncbi:uncharacterized protein LOC143997731 isoform X2 [Lithobates pipiens]